MRSEVAARAKTLDGVNQQMVSLFGRLLARWHLAVAVLHRVHALAAVFESVLIRRLIDLTLHQVLSAV